MIKVLIIEDEKNNLEVLKKMLQFVSDKIEIVGETGFVNQAIQLIKTQQPQLVFMDIELEDGTGFDILKNIENQQFKTIFTTAYNQYAIKAFKFSAVDYLLKPINPEELQNAVERAITSISEKENYEELLNRINNDTEDNIVLKTSEQRHIVPLKSIIRLEADGAYTLFVTNTQQLIISKNLKYYQDLLGDNFIRCHQSHLVQKQCIKSVDSDNNLHLSNGDNIPVSRRNRAEVLALLK